VGVIASGLFDEATPLPRSFLHYTDEANYSDPMF